MAFDGMQGTYVRRDAAGLYFMSKKGVWKPMRFPAHIDVGALIPGHKYGIELHGRELNNLIDLGPNKFFEQNLAEHEGGGAPAPQANTSFQPLQPQQVPQTPNVALVTNLSSGVPLNGLMASATGIAKSCLEGGQTDMTPHEAMIAGLRWARLWGELPPRAEELLKGTDQVSSLQKAAGMDGPQDRPAMPAGDPNDEIPF